MNNVCHYTMNTIKLSAAEVLGGAVAALAMSLAFVATADAEEYAYVDTQGEVQEVTANDWETAILVAPNIHIHSGVMILRSTADFNAVGDDVNV
jgi:hypothetical protein